jgi:hypothetical protein
MSRMVSPYRCSIESSRHRGTTAIMPDKAHVGVLKSLITEDTLTIKGKFQNAVVATDFLHIILASNDD